MLEHEHLLYVHVQMSQCLLIYTGFDEFRVKWI